MSEMPLSQAINDAQFVAMKRDHKVLCFGLGVTDPKAVFNTTQGLEAEFGSDRVFDMPTAENGMTGVAIGAALAGYRPVMVHQRLDFFLLAMDQLVNSAAKWHFMFGSQQSVPITIRLIIGRGWGQGPTHSQNLQAWFAHIPGLKVVTPSFPKQAKGLLLASIFDPNPVVFLEHRWLHNSVEDVPSGFYHEPLGKACVVRPGKHLTITAMSYLVIEALKAAAHLEKFGIDCEVIDLRSLRPLDWETIQESVSRTKRLLCLDSGFETGSISGEIIARVASNQFNELVAAPKRIAMPDIPEGTSFAMTRNFHIWAERIFSTAAEVVLGQPIEVPESLKEPTPHDVPGDWFKGPF